METQWIAVPSAVGSRSITPLYALGPDLKVSGPSTLTGCGAGASPDFASAYDNTEVEPQVAVNPTDPNEITGASQQDRWPDGGARGLSSWMSNTAGASWAKLPDVPWSACQGGPPRFGRVTDPWVSYYMALETIQGDDVINFFASTNDDGADVRSIRAVHP